jgi:hypothetical protein
MADTVRDSRPPPAPWGGSVNPSFFREHAIAFSRNGKRYAMPNNPVAFQDDPDTIATNRQTDDGPLTYIWHPDLTRYTLVGVTGPEGLGPVQEFQRDCQGQYDVSYINALTGKGGMVFVQKVTIQASGDKPSTWRYTIVFQDGQHLDSIQPA